MSKSKKISPKSKKISPKSKKISPKSKKISPNSKKISPKSKKISPKSKKISPKSKKYKKYKKISPKSKKISLMDMDMDMDIDNVDIDIDSTYIMYTFANFRTAIGQWFVELNQNGINENNNNNSFYKCLLFMKPFFESEGTEYMLLYNLHNNNLPNDGNNNHLCEYLNANENDVVFKQVSTNSFKNWLALNIMINNDKYDERYIICRFLTPGGARHYHMFGYTYELNNKKLVHLNNLNNNLSIINSDDEFDNLFDYINNIEILISVQPDEEL